MGLQTPPFRLAAHTHEKLHPSEPGEMKLLPGERALDAAPLAGVSKQLDSHRCVNDDHGGTHHAIPAEPCDQS